MDEFPELLDDLHFLADHGIATYDELLLLCIAMTVTSDYAQRLSKEYLAISPTGPNDTLRERLAASYRANPRLSPSTQPAT